jgi:PAS domain S-box-containing protein
LARLATANRRAAPAAFDETERFFDLSHDLLAIVTPDGRLRRVNGAWRSQLGYRDVELQGRPLVEFVHPEDVETTLAAIAELGDRRKADFEIHVRAKTGAYHWLRWTADLESGVIYAVARDISRQRALGDASLADEQAYSRALIESSLDAMTVTDTGGVITDVNHQMELLTKSRRDQLIGSPFRDYVTEPERADDGIEQTLRDGSVANLELIARASDGQETVLSYNATTFSDRGGAVLGVFATARDITEFKEHARLLEASNRELNAFSYSVSHDLRAPLRAIDGFSRILMTDDQDTLTDKQRRYLGLVRAGTQTMGTLIDDLLGFSRLSSQLLQRRTVDTAALVAELEDEIVMGQDGRPIEFINGELPVVQADSALLRQVFANLLGNAVKYSSKRDRPEVAVEAERRDGELVFVVRDNGVGFDLDYADKLFQVFQRLHRAEDYAGTGVGLAIVQRIVARHGGRVWAESSPDHGASFYFTLDGGAP